MVSDCVTGDGEMEVESDPEEAADVEAAPKIKKKPPKAAENKSRKEHINVVFIGHVGKIYCCAVEYRCVPILFFCYLT